MSEKPGKANFFPDVPDFPSMGTFQPVYGKFDLTTYIQGASDYEIMAFLVGKYNACLEAYGTVTKLSSDTVTACKQLQDWINSWFDNLDVQQELNNKIDSMVADGSFETLLHQTFDTQINQQTTSAVTAWLVANVTPTGSAVVVDKSLSIKGAAADAKVTGDVTFNNLVPTVPDETDLDNFTHFGTSYISSARTYINSPTIAGLLLNYDVTINNTLRKTQVIYDYTSNKVFYRHYDVLKPAWNDWVFSGASCNVVHPNAKIYYIYTNGYKITFEYIKNDSTNSQLWNITSIYKGEDVVVPLGTDILGPIKETNGSDFSGGVHGDERTYLINVTNNAESFNVVMASHIYSTIDGSNIFDRYIQLTIGNGEILVDSTYTAINTCSIDMCTNGGLIATYIKDTKALMCANIAGLPTNNSASSKENTTATIVTKYGTIVCENLIGHELETYRGFLVVYSSETEPRYKFYFNTVGKTKKFNKGEIIHGKFKYTLL